jgi:hypothetical protein
MSRRGRTQSSPTYTLPAAQETRREGAVPAKLSIKIRRFLQNGCRIGANVRKLALNVRFFFGYSVVIFFVFIDIPASNVIN